MSFDKLLPTQHTPILSTKKYCALTWNLSILNGVVNVFGKYPRNDHGTNAMEIEWSAKYLWRRRRAADTWSSSDTVLTPAPEGIYRPGA